MNHIWPTKKLGEVCDVFTDGNWIETKDQSQTGIRLIQTGNIGNGVFLDKTGKARFISSETFARLNCTEVFPGDLLISRLPEPVGRSCLVPRLDGRFITAVDCTIVRPSKSVVLPNFLLFYTNSLDYFSQIRSHLSGTTRKRISRSNLAKIEIQLPTISEQKRILEKIEKLFRKIEEAKKLREEAQKDSEALIPSALHQIFSEGKEKGWGYKLFGEIAKLKTTRNIKTNLPFVGMEDVESNTGRFLGSLDPKSVKSTTFIFNNEDVLYGKLRPYLNKVLEPDFDGHCSTEFIPIMPNKNLVLRKYLARWLRYPGTVAEIMRTTTGSRMPRADMKRILKLSIPVPPIAEQKKIVDYLDSLSERIQKLRQLQVETAAGFSALRASILHAAFEGEL